MNKLKDYKEVILGCDPELFIEDKHGVVGSEAVVPKGGLCVDEKGNSRVIRDGVQVEFNPLPKTCRQLLASELARCFRSLDEQTCGKDIKVSSSVVVEMAKSTFDKLQDENAKKFGCAKSYNTYKTKKASEIKVDPSKYLKRGAGGHIHLGYGRSKTLKAVLTNYKTIVPLMDIIVGNTCVLLDTDPANKERRKNYGRAGEYRKPKHGLEYRTLSNFWLRHYSLMSLVFGLSKFAVNVALEGLEDEFFSRVNMKYIEKAINNNDFTLAYKNFLAIEPVLLEITDNKFSDYYPLNKVRIPLFKKLVKEGIDKYFSKDMIRNWKNFDYESHDGWERFCENVLAEN